MKRIWSKVVRRERGEISSTNRKLRRWNRGVWVLWGEKVERAKSHDPSSLRESLERENGEIFLHFAKFESFPRHSKLWCGISNHALNSEWETRSCLTDRWLVTAPNHMTQPKIRPHVISPWNEAKANSIIPFIQN